MADLKRWSLDKAAPGLFECKTGGYVRHKDAEAELRRLAAHLHELRRLAAHLHELRELLCPVQAPAVGALTDEQIDALAIQWADNGIQFRTIGNGSQQQFVTLTPNRLRLLVRAALAAQPAPKTVPQGYRLIPEEFMDWVSALPEGKAQRRLEWLHSSESNDVDGWTWGVYRVKYDEAGQMVSALHTFSDFSDLDAAMVASKPPVQGSQS